MMSYLADWRKKMLKAQELERKKAREKRGVKIIIIKTGGKK